MKELIKNSAAYRVIKSDKSAGRLSHAYLVVCQDGSMHDEYLKILAKLMMCSDAEFCDECRVCRLIDEKAHPDISFYPKEGKLKTDAADDIVRQSVIKPFELEKRLFVIRRIEELNQYQNKLLKTLEEPPQNVYMLISCEKPVAVLPTVKSRAKQVEISDFSDELLRAAAVRMGFSGERLDLSLKLADGKMGNLIRYYRNDYLIDIKNLATDMLINMTGRNMPEYSAKLKNVQMTDFIGVTKLLLGKMLDMCVSDVAENGYEALLSGIQKWRYGSIIATIERLNHLEKSAMYNTNAAMLTDSILFAVMEEQTKWKKLYKVT